MNRQGSSGGLATRFHLARPNITQAEIDAVVSVLRTPNLSLGPQLVAFEIAFASYCGTHHAIACSSGTAGLHLLMQAIGIKPGDEVITTPFSFVASANCILMERGVPVFVDIDPETWNLDPRRIEAAITPATRAILPVHIFGRMAEMDPILNIAGSHDLTVIEDSCEALGSRHGGRMAGSMGHAGVFAFYPNKQITTGEGGMIVTDNDETAGLCRSLRNQGRDSGNSWLQHTRLGYNYRLSELNCALGVVQLGRIEELIAQRSRVAGLYRDRLSSESRLSLQTLGPPTGQAETSWFVFVVRLDDRYDQNDRDRILRALNESGIQCGAYFPPIHLQPFYVERFGYKVGDFPVCEALAARTIALPFHHELTTEDIEWVCEQLCRML